ncbi:MAG: thiamine pyrophosphate-binding protein [Gemmataceae bacterium]
MLDGSSVAKAFKECGVTHLTWLPDSELGAWEPALLAEPSLKVVRVCREGEAVAIAGGLYLGGRKPVIAVQCTGLFEAGDALRNFVHDLKLPLFFLVGVRSYYAHANKASNDSCPVFIEPILQAWRLPYTILDNRSSAADLVNAYRGAASKNQAAVVLIAE